MSDDTVASWLSPDGLLQVRIARTTSLSQELAIRHDLSEYSSIALGRALNTGCLLPMTWKDADRLAIQWAGAGSLGTVMVEVRADGGVRGYVSNPQAEPPKAFKRSPRPHTIGYDSRGHLVVTRQATNGKHSQSDVLLFDGSIDGDVEHWASKSEQIPTLIRVDEVDSDFAGVLLQALPGEKGASANPDLPSLDGLANIAQLSDKEVINALIPGAKLLLRTPLRFSCPCSVQRTTAGLAMLDEQELLAMMAEDEGAEITCQFCSECYHFDAAGVAAVIDMKHNMGSGGQGSA